jgi:hypothetical protein
LQYCTTGRQNAKTVFESDLYKLMANAVFGKTLQNDRLHRNYSLIADEKKLLRAVSNPAMQTVKIINDDLCMVENVKKTIMLNKPIFVGFSVLELSKLHMFDFYYNYLLKTYSKENVTLCYHDTDSFLCKIRTVDLHKDMLNDWFDLSNFSKDNKYYSDNNHKVLGKFKSETSDIIPVEFVGLRSKMYSLLITRDKPSKLTAKGIKKCYARKHLRHEQYLHTLLNKDRTTANFNLIRSTNHQLQTVNVQKICLAAFDDKRYILNDGITTLAYGHFRTRNVSL